MLTKTKKKTLQESFITSDQCIVSLAKTYTKKPKYNNNILKLIQTRFQTLKEEPVSNLIPLSVVPLSLE
jgi:hypothetical protein